MGLGPVVLGAQRRQVAGTGRPTPVMGNPVVEVAGPGPAATPRPDTGPVAQDDQLAEPVGHLVGLRGRAVVEVEHRLDDHLGGRVGTPAPHLVGQHEGAGVLHPHQRVHGAGDGGFGQVGVDHQPPTRPPPPGRAPARRLGLGVLGGVGVGFGVGQGEGEFLAGQRAGGQRPPHIQSLGAAQGGQLFEADRERVVAG